MALMKNTQVDKFIYLFIYLFIFIENNELMLMLKLRIEFHFVWCPARDDIWSIVYLTVHQWYF